MDGNRIADAFAQAMLITIILAIGFGALLMWSVPKLWTWIKPWIHHITG